MGVPSTVTFDLWHTLVYLPPEAESRYMARLVGAAVDVLERSPSEPGRPRASTAELQAQVEAASLRAVEAAHAGRTVTPEQQIAEAARATGRVVAPGAYERAISALLAATPFRAEPTAVAVLRDVRSLGYRVGLVSNTVGEPGRLLRPILERIGFGPLIETYVFSDELPWAKPAPEIFRVALDALGGDPASAIHVGDGWPDIEGAHRAGFRAGVLFTGLHAYYAAAYQERFAPAAPGARGPELTIARLPDLVPELAKLLPIAR